jgi:hypothetical protein
MAYDPAPWQNFYVMTGGAAAALTGLLFVAMSLHAKTIMSNNFYRNRAVGTLTSLATQLLLAGVVLIPGLSLTALGVLVEAAALYVLGVTISTGLRRGPETAAVQMTVTHRLIELVGGTTWIVLFNAAGISLLLHAGGGFYWLAAVMFFMFAWNIYIAWVLITEVSE